MLGFVDLFQGVNSADHRPAVAALNDVDEVGEDGGVIDGCAVELKVIQVQRPQVKVDRRSGNGAACDVAATSAQRFEPAGGVGATDDIGNDVERAAVGITRCRMQVGVGPIDDVVGAERPYPVGFACAAHCGDRGAAELREAHEC